MNEQEAQEIIDKIKTAKCCGFDGGVGIFIMSDDSRVEIYERELLLVFCWLLKIEVAGY